MGNERVWKFPSEEHSEEHLRRVLRAYADYYNWSRIPALT